MAQKKKTQAHRRRPSGKRSAARKRRAQHSLKGVFLLALIGVLAAAGGLMLDRSGKQSLADEAALAKGSALRINELMSENTLTLITDAGEVPDWIEVMNVGSEPVQTGRYALLMMNNINKMFIFPDSTLEPGECLLVYADGSGKDMSAPFKLPASGGDTLVLLNPQGQAVDSVELPELQADCAYSRAEDGSWQVSQTPTPGLPNDQTGQTSISAQISSEGDVELTEAMSSNSLYFPDESGQYYDYIELHNRSGADVDLTGWYLSDASDRLQRWSFPQVILPADGYLVVHCSGLDRRENAQHLHTNFKLSADGESVYLSQPDGEVVSMVELPALEENQAWSLTESGWSSALAPSPGQVNSAAGAAQVNAQRFSSGEGRLCLNEIMASAIDEPCDWIEIYNGTGQTVDLSGYGLSDNSSRPRKWQFPSGTTLQPGGYLAVACTDAEITAEGYLNAGFALSSDGGYTVCLTDPQGQVLDAVYLPKQYGGISYARFAGEEGFFYSETPTLRAANAGAHYASRVGEVQFSVSGGLYDAGEQLTVSLSAPAGSRIYYTLDCSDPDESATPYTQPIAISDTTIVRARAYLDGCMPSLIGSQSYLYGVENHGAYVISLVSDPDNLFSEDTGIMAMGKNPWSEYPYGKINQGANFWMDWEREGHVEVFEPDGETAISQGCGVKLHGQFSRAEDVKAFKIFARSQYGDNRFEYSLFSERDYDEYQSFLLRTSGQDYNRAFMRDVMLTSLMRGTSLMFQENELGVCYLNGEYYSLVWLRERVSKFSICQFEGWEGMEQQIDLIKANDIEKEGSNESFEALLDWIDNNDVTTQAAYDYIASQIDIENYIEYMSAEIFSGNGDTLNVKRYRNAQTDGKWRWVLFDLDWAFTTDTNSIRRWLTPGGMGTGKYTDNSLFIACMKNPIFLDQFLTYFGEQLATRFCTENVLSHIEDYYNKLEPLLPRYLEEIGLSEDMYKKELKLLCEYAQERPRKILEYFDGVFDFTDAEKEKYFGAAVEKILEYESGEAKN